MYVATVFESTYNKNTSSGDTEVVHPVNVVDVAN